jgi:hypothetical protein
MPRSANALLKLFMEGKALKFTVQYLNSTVRHSSELDAESAVAADISARIGFRWAQETHDACCYRVLDERGAVVFVGPDAMSAAKCN